MPSILNLLEGCTEEAPVNLCHAFVCNTADSRTVAWMTQQAGCHSQDLTSTSAEGIAVLILLLNLQTSWQAVPCTKLAIQLLPCEGVKVVLPHGRVQLITVQQHKT